MGEAPPPGGTLQGQFRLPLKLKFSLLITTLLVLTVVIVSAFLLRQEERTLTAEMTKRGLTMANDLAVSAKNPILTNDELTLNLLVKRAVTEPDVAYLIITEEDGKILAHPDLALIGKPLEPSAGLALVGDRLAVRPYVHPTHGPVIDFAVPVVFSNTTVGALYLGFSQKPIEAALARARRQTLLIIAVTILIGVSGAAALGTVLSRPILRLVAATRAIAAGDFHVSLAIPSRDEIGTLTESFNRMAQSLRDKEMIKRAFTRYVPREVVEEILKDPAQLVLKGERRDVTVLFCDLRGFTVLSERLSPEATVSLLNEFYTLMIDATFKHDGTLQKFLGDGVMAVFGAPISHPDHAARAIKTALDMQAGVAELSRRRVRDGQEPIAVGIGVSAGEAVAGTVGTLERMEYTVIGDSVNLAAHLEARAEPGQILMTARTYQELEGHVRARSMGILQVKGEAQVEAYEVLGLSQIA